MSTTTDLREFEVAYAPVVAQIASDLRLSDPDAAQTFDRLRQWLQIAATSAEPLRPENDVDQAWHTFILHTRLYETYCRDHLGGFVHHTPEEDGDCKSDGPKLADCRSDGPKLR